MGKQDDIEISQADLKYIVGDELTDIENKILKNVWCHKCSPDKVSEIVDYKMFVNDLNDVIFRGKCENCGSPVNSYVETGEENKFQSRIMMIKKKITK